MAAGLDLRGGDGVVFVDNGDDLHFQQSPEGAPQVLGPNGSLHILAGEQDLGNAAVILGKEGIVHMHHAALAHGGGRLLHPQFLWPLGKAQAGGAHADGAGADQNDLMAHTLEVRQDPHQMLHAAKIKASGLVGEGRGANLDHDPLFRTLHMVIPPKGG